MSPFMITVPMLSTVYMGPHVALALMMATANLAMLNSTEIGMAATLLNTEPGMRRFSGMRMLRYSIISNVAFWWMPPPYLLMKAMKSGAVWFGQVGSLICRIASMCY